MAKKHPSNTPMNQLRPVHLARNTTTRSPLEEPPSQLPGFHDVTPDTHPIDSAQIDKLETMKHISINQFSRAWYIADEDTIEIEADISAFPTTRLQVVKTLQSTLPHTRETYQPIYASTAYARRLERHLRAKEKKLGWKDIQQFSQFVVPFKWQIALVFLLTVGIGLTALPLPFIFRTMLDNVFLKHNVSLFILLLGFLLAVSLLQELLSFCNRNVQGSLSRAANLNITFRFYRHMLRLPLSFYQGLSSTGQVLSRLNEVTSAQQTIIQVLLDSAGNIVLVLIYTGVLFLTDWRLTLAVMGVAPFYIGVSLYFNRRARQFSRQVLESYAVMNGAMYEGLTGLKTIKALAAEHRFGRMIKRLIIQTNQLSFRRTIFQSEANLVIGIVQALATIVILGFGGYLVLTNALSAGLLAAFVLILRQLSTPVTTLNGVNQQLQTAAVAIDRLFEILNYPEEAGAEKGVELPQVKGNITFEHIHFSYIPGIEVLHDINLYVKAGTTIALVGRSGAGKTTMANLLMRFYMPDSGRVTIDGHDLRELKIESLRSLFGVILQDDSLFSGTIQDNLTFGLLRKVSCEELEEAAHNANILDYIQSLPLGFKTVLHERGQSLSGGQRQRIAIARMFIRQPKILIMDEPSSALDNESEALIQQALKRLTRGRTTFIIAHRLSTIRNADRIVIIDAGRIVEQGTHDELLALKGTYWQLYNSYGRM
jgi:ABC-type bacteriocin/lantibiotic exporter with double-glycine peptidase domain